MISKSKEQKFGIGNDARGAVVEVRTRVPSRLLILFSGAFLGKPEDRPGNKLALHTGLAKKQKRDGLLGTQTSSSSSKRARADPKFSRARNQDWCLGLAWG